MDLFQSYTPVKLHYTSCSMIDYQDPSVPPIILIHGFFASSITWARTKFQISNKTRRKVYAVDLRNHGKSEYCDEMTLKHMCADVLQFMNDEKIQRASFIGHSAGGRVAMELALHKPEMVENLVVEDIAIRDACSDRYNAAVAFTKEFQKGVEALPVTLSETEARKLMNQKAAKYFSQISSKAPEDTSEISTLFYKDGTTGEFKISCNMGVLGNALSQPIHLRNDVTGDPTYTGKTLFIKGEHTIMPIDEDRQTILKHFPNARFETIKGAYHVSHVEKANAFTRAVINFLLENKNL